MQANKYDRITTLWYKSIPKYNITGNHTCSTMSVDGTVDTHSSGTLVAPDGTMLRLQAGEFRLIPGRVWESPTSGELGFCV